MHVAAAAHDFAANVYDDFYHDLEICQHVGDLFRRGGLTKEVNGHEAIVTESCLPRRGPRLVIYGPLKKQRPTRPARQVLHPG
jgi:hypothetical protein